MRLSELSTSLEEFDRNKTNRDTAFSKTQNWQTFRLYLRLCLRSDLRPLVKLRTVVLIPV